MKRFALSAFVLIALLASPHAKADCTLGEAPGIPDGSKATQEEMIAAQKAIKSYVAETQEYLSCVEFEGKGRSGGEWTRRYNEASNRMEKLASEFNKQLKAFKSR
jgi:hypothetical protein